MYLYICTMLNEEDIIIKLVLGNKTRRPDMPSRRARLSLNLSMPDLMPDPTPSN
jgi:hypothetical protein